MERALEEKWGDDDVARRYATGRWRNARAQARDLRHVRTCLAELRASGARILDLPSGTGRLAAAIAPFAALRVAVDVAPAMLRLETANGSRVVARAEELPFPARSFDVVVCCRLLHHLSDEPLRRRVLAELVRVSRRYLVASFWDAGSFQALRRARRPRRGTRAALAKAALAAELAVAGARVLRYRHGLRFVTQQTFVVAERVEGHDAGSGW